MILLLYILELLLLAIWARARLRHRWDAHLLSYLEAVEGRVRAGVPGAAWLQDDASTRALSAQLVRMERAGRSLRSGLKALRREMTYSTASCRQRDQLWRLAFGRASLAVAAALAGRLWLVGWGYAAAIQDDRGALVLAALALAVGLLHFHMRLPRHWFGGPQLSSQAHLWLRSFMECGPVTGGPLAAELKELRRIQLRSGSSREDEIRERLRAWALREQERFKARLGALEESLPLLELLCFGGSAGLILIVPLLEAMSLK